MSEDLDSEKLGPEKSVVGAPLPVFPDITPSKIVKRAFHLLEDGDLASQEDFQKLLDLMYRFSERDFYIVTEKSKSLNPLLLDAEGSGLISLEETNFFYYAHPNFSRDYIHIQPDKCRFDWEKDVVAKGPMYKKTKFKMTEFGRRSRDIADLKQNIETTLIERADDNPLLVQPNFMGFGIDLVKLGHWGRRMVSKFRKR